jgi:hypothetical protein
MSENAQNLVGTIYLPTGELRIDGSALDWRLLPARLERLTVGSAAYSLKPAVASNHDIPMMPSSGS